MSTLLRPWLQLLVKLVGCAAQAPQPNCQPDKSYPALHALQWPNLLLSRENDLFLNTHLLVDGALADHHADLWRVYRHKLLCCTCPVLLWGDLERLAWTL